MSDTNTTPTPESTDNSQASPPATPQGNNGGNEAAFSQADVDRITTRARHEAREIVQKKLLEDLGLESIDSLKSIITDAQKRKESEMSEAQKLQLQIEALTKKAQEAEQRALATETRYLNEQRRNVFESALTASGSSNAKRVYTLLQLDKPTEFLSVFGDDATPDDGKLKALVKQVQADYPEYFGNPGAGSPSNSNGVAPNSMNNDEVAKQIRKKFGKL
jgi:hypothetical protein